MPISILVFHKNIIISIFNGFVLQWASSELDATECAQWSNLIADIIYLPEFFYSVKISYC